MYFIYFLDSASTKYSIIGTIRQLKSISISFFRLCGTASHTIAFLLLLGARDWYNAMVVCEGRLYDTATFDQLQPVNPWTKTGITPTKSAPNHNIDNENEIETVDEDTDMRTAMEFNDPIIAMGLEYYGGLESDSDEDHVYSQEASEDEGEDANYLSFEGTFHSALESNESNDSWVTAVEPSKNASSIENSCDGTEAVASTNLTLPNKSTSTSFGPTSTSTPAEKSTATSTGSKRPQSPLLSAVSKKPALSKDASSVTTRNFRARRAIFKPPFRETVSNPEGSTNPISEAVEATRQSLSRAEISTSEGHQITIEERSSLWPSWLKLHNPRNACWFNSTTNGLIWTLKSQGISSIGRPPPNSAPGQWRPLDFFKYWFSLDVGASANPILFLQKLASRKKQPALARDQFPAEKLFELKEFIECWYQRLCPILLIKRSASQCTNQFCLQTSDPQESFSMEHLMSLTFEEGASSYSLQEMVLRFCEATFQSDCEFCGQEDSVTRTTQTLIREPKDGIILICKRVKYINGQRVSNYSINFPHPTIYVFMYVFIYNLSISEKNCGYGSSTR